MGCGDIGVKLLKEGVKYGVEKGAEAIGLPKPVAKGIAAVLGFFLD